MTAGPLAGIRVLDVTTTVLGPVTTQLLGDLGADVIKIETVEGDPMRFLGPSRNAGMGAMFLSNNRNKRSVVLDLKRPAARVALDCLIETADVFVHNMRPQAAARLNIDYASVRTTKPEIIYASATGYKADGPCNDKPAFDDIIEGASGIPDLFMKMGGEPQYAPFAAADKVSAYMLALAIGMALFHRERTGKGQEVHVPMLETMVAFNLHEHLWGGCFEPPMGAYGYSRMATPHRRPFKTLDGYICVMPVTDAQWKRLLICLGRPDLAEDPRFAKMEQRGRNFDALYKEVRNELAKGRTRDLMSALEQQDVPCGPVNRLEDMRTDEYFVATKFFEAVEHPTEGKLITTAIPVSYSETPGSIRLPAPNLGQHTREILGQLGFGEAEIDSITNAS